VSKSLVDFLGSLVFPGVLRRCEKFDLWLVLMALEVVYCAQVIRLSLTCPEELEEQAEVD
jgi:hypothetical protein